MFTDDINVNISFPVETAENIGYSCKLLTDGMQIHYGEDVK